jgi:hypothetical protein
MSSNVTVQTSGAGIVGKRYGCLAWGEFAELERSMIRSAHDQGSARAERRGSETFRRGAVQDRGDEPRAANKDLSVWPNRASIVMLSAVLRASNLGNIRTARRSAGGVGGVQREVLGPVLAPTSVPDRPRNGTARP